jgi:hypothetical protein
MEWAALKRDLLRDGQQGLSCLLRNARRKTMSKLSALVLIATIATAASALPAFAQSFDPDAGTGNIAPFNAAPSAPQTERVAVRQAGHVTAAARQASGLHAFAMVTAAPGDRVGGVSYDPALTGGGSLGYNQNLANY